MKAINLGGESNLFVATDPIKTAQELQTHLSGVPLAGRREIAVQALDALGDPRELFGGTRVYVHSLGAFILANGVSDDATLYHGTYFSDAYFDGSFGKFGYIEHSSVGGLCLLMYETTVVASKSNPDFVGENIRSGVFVPVHSVESAFAA